MPTLHIVGDRVLVEIVEQEQLTQSGLVLPATVGAREEVATGKVVKVGPGYLTANPDYSSSQPWNQPKEAIRYLPLQAEPNDFAYFLKKEAIPMRFEKREYFVLRHASILALVRPDSQDLIGDIESLLRN